VVGNLRKRRYGLVLVTYTLPIPDLPPECARPDHPFKSFNIIYMSPEGIEPSTY